MAALPYFALFILALIGFALSLGGRGRRRNFCVLVLISTILTRIVADPSFVESCDLVGPIDRTYDVHPIDVRTVPQHLYPLLSRQGFANIGLARHPRTGGFYLVATIKFYVSRHEG